MSLTNLVYNSQYVNDRSLWEQQVRMPGYNLVAGSFEEGAVLNTVSDAAWFLAAGKVYTWAGTLPKTIPAKSSPASSGGIGSTGWQEVKSTWTTPQAWSSLKACFESSYENVYIPPGTYTLTDTMTANITGNKRVQCAPGARIRLADNVRKNLMVFVGVGTNSFEWCGGEVDGNWEGQGPETLTNGSINDVSHGFITSKFQRAHIHDMYVHDCMGHHINHGGNTYFTAERIRIRAHPSALKPLGGARGDGITGCSGHVVIRDISGFSTDDFIAIVSGIDWIAGWYPNRMSVESILVENIRCEVYNYQGTDRYCWTGVSVGNSLGYSTKGKVTIRNVHGSVLSRGIGYTAESYGTDYYGTFEDNATIENIDLYVAGDPANGFTARKNTAHIVIGCEGFNTASSARNNYCKTVTISNVTCRGSAYCGTGIILGHMQTRDVYINDVKCTYENATDNMVTLMIVGQKDIGAVTLENVYQQVVGASTDTVRNAKKIIESYYGGSGAMTLNGRNLTKQPNVAGTGYVPNGTSLAATGFSKVSPRLYGKDLLWDLDSSGTGGVAGLPLVDGVNFSTPALGHVSYSKTRDAWTFHEFAVTWDTTNFGKPAAANFTNFANFSWKVGTVVPVQGSPLQECQAYVCTGTSPTFALVSNSFSTASNVLQSSGWTPLNNPLTPGMRITSTIPSGSTDAGWPVTGGAVVETYIGTNTTNFFDTFQEWRTGVNRKIRYWGGASWGGWV